jgi:hypothetical protein
LDVGWHKVTLRAALGSEMVQESKRLFEMVSCIAGILLTALNHRTWKTEIDGDEILWDARPCVAIGDLEAEETTMEIN